MKIEISKSELIELLEKTRIPNELKKEAFTKGLGNYETDDFTGAPNGGFYFYGGCSEKDLVELWDKIQEENK